MIPRERRAVYGLTHLMLPWVYQMASHPGCWMRWKARLAPTSWFGGSDWFVKFPPETGVVYLVAPGRSVLGIEPAQSDHRVDCASPPARSRERMHAGNAGNAEDAASATGDVRAG